MIDWSLNFLMLSPDFPMNVFVIHSNLGEMLFLKRHHTKKIYLKKEIIALMKFNDNIHEIEWLIDWFLVFNATFSNISAISWRPVLVLDSLSCSFTLFCFLVLDSLHERLSNTKKQNKVKEHERLSNTKKQNKVKEHERLSNTKKQNKVKEHEIVSHAPLLYFVS
jgi:hypothetical protein